MHMYMCAYSDMYLYTATYVRTKREDSVDSLAGTAHIALGKNHFASYAPGLCQILTNPDGTCRKMPKNQAEIRSGRVPGASGIDPGPFRNAPERRKQKKTEKRGPKIPQFFSGGRFWDPVGNQKSRKNVPGRQKVRPGTALEPFFCVFLRRCRSESGSGPIFGRSDP